MSKTRPYAILDVFAKTPLKGNPLAVVLEADDLDDETMQKIAGEFNLSETVFVRTPEDPSNDAALRIFTPGKELPFAGHPTVGAAVLLARQKSGPVDESTDAAVVLEERVGLVRAGVVVRPDRTGHATFTVPKKPEEVGPSVSRVLLAEALGLDEDDIGFARHRPAIYSAGNPFTLVPVRSVNAVNAVRPNLSAWDRAFSMSDATNAFIYTPGGVASDAAFHARMFWPEAGLGEDPATGSAVASLAGAIVDFDRPGNGTHQFLIEQGFAMGRPSQMMLEIDIENDDIFALRIGGDAVILAEGTLFV
ncbi:MAG: PhzF family phenazine biosynthesis protein [Pseudomonadota bacterium]